jgi:hypothetical protein
MGLRGLRPRMSVPARLGLTLLGLLVAPAAQAHVLLDPDRVQALLGEVARHQQAAREGPAEAERAESLFRLGETVEPLVDLLNQDLAAHGPGDLLARLLVQRLEAHGVRVAFSPEARRYAYDLAAFREYLRRAPGGRWAAEARFRLIAARFHEAPLPDAVPERTGHTAPFLEAAQEEERFLREHAGHDRAPLVRFYLAVDYYRVMRAAADRSIVREYRERARQALAAVARATPESAEARAAQVLLERLGETPDPGGPPTSGR